jgi:hypothetical protein
MKLTSLSIMAAISFSLPALSQVEPRVAPGTFPTNQDPQFGGGFYPSLSGVGVVNGNEVTGPVTVDLARHFAYDGTPANQIDTTMTVIYTLDGNKISGRLTSPYTYVWDSTTVPDGSHVMSVIIVDGSGVTTQYVPTATAFNVANTGTPPIGNQRIASVGGGWLRVWYKTTLPTWLPWNTGYTWPHPATTTPYVAPVSPPANTRGLADAGLSLGFTVEMATQSNVTLENAPVYMVRSKTGYLEVETYDPEDTTTSDGSVAGVMASYDYDGPRNDNLVSAYSTFVTNPDPTIRGYVGVDLAGRVFTLGLNGTVQTIAGRQLNKAIVPYSSRDPRVTEADRRALQINMIGNFNGAEFNEPTDLAFDPRNKNILYIADQGNARIAKVDLSVTPPNVTTYAGLAGTSGNVDGAALSARFGGPNSIVMAPSGIMYVADYDNNSIRMITADGTTVSTIASATQGLSQPFVIRFDSHGNIILAELTGGSIKHLDLTSHAVTTIAANMCGQGWTWLAVDAKANVGPVDDIFVNCDAGGDNSTLVRMASDGTRQAPGGNWGLNGGHYPWALVINDYEARMLTMGFGDTAPRSYRFSVPGDNTITTGYIYPQMNPVTNRMWDQFDAFGTMYEFPDGMHPAQSALRGNGYSTFPGVLSYDDLAAMTTAQIGAYIQAGLGDPANPRPEITGLDLQYAVQDIQQDSALFPNPLLPFLPTPPADVTPPIISNVSAAMTEPNTAQVTWTTDKATIGYVRFGSTANYFRWSPLEAGYGTSHTVTLSDTGAAIHYMIVSEDQASNLTGTVDKTVDLAAPAVTLTRGAPLTWSSTNATACTGTGFTAGGTSGTVIVAPGNYSIACTGPGGTSAPVSITIP